MSRSALLAVAMLAVALSGCSFAPAYHPPAIATPPVFKEAGPWIAANPARAPNGDWWHAFGDATLDGLETRLGKNNPTLAGALARYDQARAYLGEVHAAALPSVGIGAMVTGNRQSDDRPLRGANQPNYYGAHTLDIGIGWDPDLWGRVRNSVAAGRADAQASADDVAAVRLALQTELALRYVDLRALDAKAKLLAATVDAYGHADGLIQRRFRGGIASGVDTARSGAMLADARAELADVGASRALVEHAIASLVGASASDFSITSVDTDLTIPGVPDILPSTLLQRRADIAAAERRMFAANANIGVARGAFFPALSLSATGGVQGTVLGELLTAPNSFWSIGPSAVLSIFDGGRRHAKVAEARAQWSQATADYRAKVLQAFQQVEDALAQCRDFATEAKSREDAVRFAGSAEQLALNRYVKGAVTYLDVSTAQATALSARSKAIDLHARRLAAAIRLISASGGGWNADT